MPESEYYLDVGTTGYVGYQTETAPRQTLLYYI